MVILQFTALTAYWVMILRLTRFDNVPTLISMLLAILTLFVASIETMIDSKIKMGSTYLMSSLFFKILKASMTIIVFSVNGNTNDFFVAWFFLAVSINGIIYLRMSGYRRQLETSDKQLFEIKDYQKRMIALI